MLHVTCTYNVLINLYDKKELMRLSDVKREREEEEEIKIRVLRG